MSLVSLVVALLIIAVVFFLINYIIDNLIPAPSQRIIKVVVNVVFALIVLLWLLQLFGFNLNLPTVRQ
jgi:hypothetical protein